MIQTQSIAAMFCKLCFRQEEVLNFFRITDVVENFLVLLKEWMLMTANNKGAKSLRSGLTYKFGEWI